MPRRRTSVRLRHNPSLESQSLPPTATRASSIALLRLTAPWLTQSIIAVAPTDAPLSASTAQMSLDAATQGLGVALESATNASGHIADGRLKPVFGLDKAVRVKAYFVVYPARHSQHPPVEGFLAWIHGEAAKWASS